MRRLYWRIYLGFVMVVVLFAVIIATLFAVAGPERQRDALMEGIAATVADLLPDSQVAGPELQRSLRRLSRRFRTFASLYSADGRLLAQAGDAVKAGQPLAVMEAMKMEHTIAAPRDAPGTSFRFEGSRSAPRTPRASASWGSGRSRWSRWIPRRRAGTTRVSTPRSY